MEFETNAVSKRRSVTWKDNYRNYLTHLSDGNHISLPTLAIRKNSTLILEYESRKRIGMGDTTRVAASLASL
ncbi:hypothetical protein E2C01_051485 [Portunus trituberculatus]|uniref:Uncharacterized protein n=1 Tax=Portunus trituberculatus TaxID=210409 RepID=A0A5B7GLW7_PORTR|nr:hypothetical protein [Portunus trituberculatus]